MSDVVDRPAGTSDGRRSPATHPTSVVRRHALARPTWHVVAAAMIFCLAMAAACVPLVLSPKNSAINVAPLPASALQAPVQAPMQSSAHASQGAPTELHVVATDFHFEASIKHLVVGESISLILDNHGVMQHNLQVQGTDLKVVADPGQSTRGEITFSAAGDYTFLCTIPGHKEAGMSGKLVVGDAGAPVLESPASNSDDVQPLPDGITRLPQPQVAPTVHRTEPATISVDLETREVTALLADGIAYRYWTFNGTVPGPMIRVRQGDTVDLHLHNAPGTQATHSINLHAVSGPGGGAWTSQTAPSSDGGFQFKATRAGVYIYHCMTAPVGQHVANGMYGMIVVEPPEGLPVVDHEWYVMEGDIFLKGDRALKGLRTFSFDKLMDEKPDYVVFNGSVGSLTGANALRAKVGETVRIFFGVGGPVSDSALHVVGGIFEKLHPEGALETLTNVQTTLVPPGGSTMAELTFDAPGQYMIEDHHIIRLEKGAMAEVEVDGPDQPDIFRPNQASASHTLPFNAG